MSYVSPTISVLSKVAYTHDGKTVTGKVRGIWITPNEAGVSTTMIEVDRNDGPSTICVHRFSARIDNLKKINLVVID